MKITLSFILLFILFTTISYSQNIDDIKMGVISGEVVNFSTLEAIPSATVKIIGTKLGAITKSDGKFIIKNIPVGVYQVLVTTIGYEPETISDIIVQTSRPFTLQAKLISKVNSIDTLVVRAKSFRRDPDVTVSQNKFSNEEIRRLPGGFEDVVRAISLLPGVAQVQNGRNDLLVRGGGPSENLFLIDGIEASNINHFGSQGAGGGPLSFINLDLVRETDFSTGGFGAKFGDKLSSVLKIDLRKGREDKQGGKLTLAATQFGLNLEGPITEKGSYLFSTRRSYLDFLFKAAGFSFVPEYWDFLGKADFEINDNNKISALGICVLDNVKQFNDTPDKRSNNASLVANSQNQVVAGISWKNLFENGFVSTTFGRTLIRFKIKQTDTSGFENFVNNSVENEYNLKSDFNLLLSPKTEISFGGNLKTILFKSEIFLKKQGGDINSKLDSTFYKAGLYFNLSKNFGDLKTNLGLRGDYFSGIENQFYPSVRASISYAVNDITNLSLSGGRYFQHPSYIWLVSNLENRKLKDIQVDQIVVGVDRLLEDDFKASIEGYYKLYSNYPASLIRPYLVLANTGAGFNEVDEGYASYGFDPLASIGKGRAYGLEFLIQKKYTTDFPLYGLASLSLNQSFFTALDGIENPSDYSQPIIFNFSTGFRTNSWEFGCKFRFASGRPFSPIDTVKGDPNFGFRDVSKYNSERLSASHSLDIRIDKNWQFENSTLVTYIDIQNIYNKKNLSVPSFDQTKRIIKSGTNAIGILPSIGISWEF